MLACGLSSARGNQLGPSFLAFSSRSLTFLSPDSGCCLCYRSVVAMAAVDSLTLLFKNAGVPANLVPMLPMRSQRRRLILGFGHCRMVRRLSLKV